VPERCLTDQLCNTTQPVLGTCNTASSKIMQDSSSRSLCASEQHSCSSLCLCRCCCAHFWYVALTAPSSPSKLSGTMAPAAASAAFLACKVVPGAAAFTGVRQP
jgi:hypothetical protein